MTGGPSASGSLTPAERGENAVVRVTVLDVPKPQRNWNFATHRWKKRQPLQWTQLIQNHGFDIERALVGKLGTETRLFNQPTQQVEVRIR